MEAVQLETGLWRDGKPTVACPCCRGRKCHLCKMQGRVVVGEEYRRIDKAVRKFKEKQ